MVMVESGLDWKGEPCEFYMNVLLHKELTEVKRVVTTSDFDYVSLFCGLPGMGKSNLAQSVAKFLDPNFTVDNICMTAEDFVAKTTTCPKHSAIILDESFASLNSRVATSKDFLKILNHLQIIRQRNLFVLLCLPNFFDLGKAISIYRSMHLFVVYGAEFGKRGEFAAFGRDKKRNLYIKGLKFMNYQCVSPNFRGKFYKQKAIDDDLYDNKKLEHLREQNKALSTEKITKDKGILMKMVQFMKNEGKSCEELAKLTGRSVRTMERYVKGEV